MKTEMQMMPNGNYECVISPIQHKCVKDIFRCIEYGWEPNKLILEMESGDPYEDGCYHEIEINFCPFCGYSIKKKKK